MAINDDVDLDVLIDNLKELKNNDDMSKGDKKQAIKESVEIIKQAIDKFNPLDNEYKTNDMKIGWKVDPSLNQGQTKFSLEFNKELRDDDIEISFKVNGRTEIFHSNRGSNNLQVKTGLKFKF